MRVVQIVQHRFYRSQFIQEEAAILACRAVTMPLTIQVSLDMHVLGSLLHSRRSILELVMYIVLQWFSMQTSAFVR